MTAQPWSTVVRNRRRLERLDARRDSLIVERDAAICMAATDGCPITALAQLAGLSRRTVYDILERQAQR